MQRRIKGLASICSSWDTQISSKKYAHPSHGGGMGWVFPQQEHPTASRLQMWLWVQHLARRDVREWGEEHDSWAWVASQRMPEKTPLSFKRSVFWESQGYSKAFLRNCFFSPKISNSYKYLNNILICFSMTCSLLGSVFWGVVWMQSPQIAFSSLSLQGVLVTLCHFPRFSDILYWANSLFHKLWQIETQRGQNISFHFVQTSRKLQTTLTVQPQ